MSGFKRIKDIDDLRKTIEEIYDVKKNKKSMEELLPKASYKFYEAETMNARQPHQEESLEQKEAFIDMIMNIFDDVCRNENVPVKSIVALYYGSVSVVFKVGNKVIKLGGFRYTSTIPNTKYIVKPLLRRYMPVDGSDSGLFVEVTERVDDAYPTEEEMYRLYAKLRDNGIEWADVKRENMGVLLKDNVIHWNEKLDPSPETTMLDGKLKGRPLKKGEYVVLDADLMYRDKAPDEFVNNAPRVYNYVTEFRKRYEEEHTKKARGLKLFPQAIRKIFSNPQNDKKKK